MSRLKFVAFAAAFPLLATCAEPPAGWATTAHASSWQYAFDLDGDGERDSILVDYTGGGHCCYRLTVILTSTKKPHRLPFQLDGGYVGGLSPIYADRFDIRKTDGALPELVMEIETYNGEPLPLPEAWTRRYGITTHYIAVGFADGRQTVRDWPREKMK